MEDNMAVDVGLWFLLAATVAFIYCGCMLTAGKKKPLKLHGGTFDHNVDQAAWREIK
jgi:hypothetical protein